MDDASPIGVLKASINGGTPLDVLSRLTGDVLTLDAGLLQAINGGTLADQQLILEVGMQIRRIAPVALVLAAAACGEAALDPGSAGVSPVRSRIAPGATTALVAPSPVSISAPLQIDKTTVSAGRTVTGTVTYQNTSASSITHQSARCWVSRRPRRASALR